MIDSYDKTRLQVERVRAAMQDGMFNDPRFRMLVDSSVGFVMQEHGPVNPERADADAHDIARTAAAMLLARVYDEDGELAAMRAERDRYKQLAEDAIMMTPRPFFIPKELATA